MLKWVLPCSLLLTFECDFLPGQSPLQYSRTVCFRHSSIELLNLGSLSLFDLIYTWGPLGGIDQVWGIKLWVGYRGILCWRLFLLDCSQWLIGWICWSFIWFVEYRFAFGVHLGRLFCLKLSALLSIVSGWSHRWWQFQFWSVSLCLLLLWFLTIC